MEQPDEEMEQPDEEMAPVPQNGTFDGVVTRMGSLNLEEEEESLSMFVRRELPGWNCSFWDDGDEYHMGWEHEMETTEPDETDIRVKMTQAMELHLRKQLHNALPSFVAKVEEGINENNKMTVRKFSVWKEDLHV